MTHSTDVRPGVDTEIVQTNLLRGHEALFGGRDGGDLEIRGGDCIETFSGGSVIVEPGKNQNDDTVGNVYLNRRSRLEQDEIVILVAGESPTSGGQMFNIYGGPITPEGTIFAPESSLFFENDTPGLWIKTTPVGVNTGWEQIATVPAVAEDLEETLQIGNVTGALPIIVNNTNSGVHGEDGVGVDGISYVVRSGNSGGGAGGSLEVLSGAVTSGTGDGGRLTVAAGSSFGGPTGGRGGPVQITAGASGTNFDGGSITLTAGVGGPNLGGDGGSLFFNAGAGGGGGGGDIRGVAGNGATGQLGGGITWQGGSGAPGGGITLTGGGGDGANAAGGGIFLTAGVPDAGGGAGANISIMASSAVGAFAGGNITLTPGTGTPDGVVTVNGKLTVTGIIDPIGLVFQETSGGTDVPVPANEGALYVSDGSSGRTDNALYYKDDSGSHWQIAPPPAGSGLSFVEAFTRMSWGSIQVTDTTVATELVGGTGLWEDADGFDSGGVSNFGRTIGSEGPALLTQTGAVLGNWAAIQGATAGGTGLVRREHRYLATFKFNLGVGATNTDFFVGFTDQAASAHGAEAAGSIIPMNSNIIGLVKEDDGSSDFDFYIENGAGTTTRIATGEVVSTQVLYLVVDATASDSSVTLKLLDDAYNEIASQNYNAGNTSLPSTTIGLRPILITKAATASNREGNLYEAAVVTRADLLADAIGGASPLSVVLGVGNTTGGTSIEITHGDFILGEADGNAGAGGTIGIISGETTNAANFSGNLTMGTGANLDPGATGGTGTVLLASGPMGVTQLGTTGSATFGTGGHGGAGNSGIVTVSSGSAGGNSGGVTISTGAAGGTPGTLALVAGSGIGATSAGGPITATAGNSGDAVGANITLNAGSPTGGNNDGGSIVLNPGTGFGTGNNGVVFVNGKLTVTGIIDPTGMVFDNVASVPEGTPAAGKSTLWVRASDNALILTNDSGTDTEIGSGGGVPLTVQDEGGNVDTNVALINFIGAGVTAASGGAGIVNVTIPGGVGGEDLATTLGFGNTTGGLNIELTSGSELVTPDAVTPDDLTIRSGSATGAGTGAGKLGLVSGNGNDPGAGAGGDGGPLSITGGAGANSGTGKGGEGANFAVQLGAGGSTTFAAADGGSGGSFSLVSGTGGNSTTGNSGLGGSCAFTLGDGGNSTNGTPGLGGGYLFVSGAGGDESTSGIGANGGGWTVTLGSGGQGAGALNDSGDGGGVTLTAGAGGAAILNANGGDGGGITLTAGDGGAGNGTGGDGQGGGVNIAAGGGPGTGGSSVFRTAGPNPGPFVVSQPEIQLLTSNDALGGDGAYVRMFSGLGTGGGDFRAFAGASSAGIAGDMLLEAGTSTLAGAGTGGEAALIGGDSTDALGTAGNVRLTPGPASGGGVPGFIDLDGGIGRDQTGYKHGTVPLGPVPGAVNPIAFGTPFPALPLGYTISVEVETAPGAPPPIHWIHTIGPGGFTVEFPIPPPAFTVLHWTARA